MLRRPRNMFSFITADRILTSSQQVPVHLSQLRELKVCSLIRDEEMLESFLPSFLFPKLSSLTLGSLRHPLNLEKLLQMVKACSRADDRSGKHRIEETKVKSVTLHCREREGKIKDEVLDFMKEIKFLGVDLNVVFADDAENESDQCSLSDDYSDESYDDETIYYNDLAW